MTRPVMMSLLFSICLTMACGGSKTVKPTKTDQQLTQKRNFYTDDVPKPTPADKIRRIPGPRGITFLAVDGDYRTADSLVVFPMKMGSYKRSRGMEMSNDRRNVFFAYSYPNYLLTSYAYPNQAVKQGEGGAAKTDSYKKHFGGVINAIQQSYQNVKVRDLKVIDMQWRGQKISGWYAELSFTKQNIPMISWAFLTQYDGWYVKHRVSTNFTSEAQADAARKEAFTYMKAFSDANVQ